MAKRTSMAVVFVVERQMSSRSRAKLIFAWHPVLNSVYSQEAEAIADAQAEFEINPTGHFRVVERVGHVRGPLLRVSWQSSGKAWADSGIVSRPFTPEEKAEADRRMEEHYERSKSMDYDPTRDRTFHDEGSDSQRCACGHEKWEHACKTHRGLCFTCYGSSEHGMKDYCQRFRRAR